MMELASIGKPTDLTAFGRIARFVFIAGMYVQLNNKGMIEAVDKIKPIVERAYMSIDKSALKILGAPPQLHRTVDKLSAKLIGVDYADILSKWFLQRIRDNENFPN